MTLEQVAQDAGVSLATASRVLNGNGVRPVRADLSERVLASARSLHYTPNAHAQALVAGSTSTVGLVTHDVSDPYFAAIARGAMQVATQHDTLLMLASTMRDPARELAYVSALRAQRARAILLIGSGFNSDDYVSRMREELDAFTHSGGRVAMVSEHRLPFDTVLPDNRGGGADLARSLLALGHRDFGVLAGPRSLITVIDRLEGFTTAVSQGGGRIEPSQVVEAEFSQAGGFEAMRELLDRGLTASVLFCVSDVMAIGALEALRQAGVDVPGEVSVVGFDDIPIVRQLTPALSTVALPLEEMGARVMGMALKAPSVRPRTRSAAATVILRATTAPPRTSRAKRRART